MGADRFPQVDRYQQGGTGPFVQLLDWAKPGETIVIYDRACRSARVTRRGAALSGRVHRSFQLVEGRPDEMSESYAQIRIGWRFDEFPSNWTHYRRDDEGNWRVETRGGGDWQRAGGEL